MTELAANASSLPLLAVALLATGVVAGLLAGLLGVGGGIVIVPTLYYLFEALELAPHTSMHMAVGTSLASIIPTSLSSMRSHFNKGVVDPALLKLWCVPILAGSTAGATIAGFVSGTVLCAVFASIALLVAVNIAARRSGFTVAPALPGRQSVHVGIGGAIGVFSAMMGIGGGTLSVPVLCLFSYPIHRAVGTASALGLLIAVPGAIAYALSGLGVPDRPASSFGYVNLMGVAAIVPMTVLMAPVGVKLAHCLDEVWLRRLFALFLTLTALRMFWRTLF